MYNFINKTTSQGSPTPSNINFTATEMNNIAGELKNIVLASGQSLSSNSAVMNQLAKSGVLNSHIIWNDSSTSTGLITLTPYKPNIIVPDDTNTIDTSLNVYDLYDGMFFIFSCNVNHGGLGYDGIRISLASVGNDPRGSRILLTNGLTEVPNNLLLSGTFVLVQYFKDIVVGEETGVFLLHTIFFSTNEATRLKSLSQNFGNLLFSYNESIRSDIINDKVYHNLGDQYTSSFHFLENKYLGLKYNRSVSISSAIISAGGIEINNEYKNVCSFLGQMEDVVYTTTTTCGLEDAVEITHNLGNENVVVFVFDYVKKQFLGIAPSWAKDETNQSKAMVHLRDFISTDNTVYLKIIGSNEYGVNFYKTVNIAESLLNSNREYTVYHGLNSLKCFAAQFTDTNRLLVPTISCNAYNENYTTLKFSGSFNVDDTKVIIFGQPNI